MATVRNFIVRQGETFIHVLRWETSPIIYVPITAITKSAPVSISATGHGLKDGWRAAVVSVLGMTALNALSNPPKDNDYHNATVVDANTITFNDINSAGFQAYKSGGYLQYNNPHTLAGYTARMAIKDKIGGTVLDTLTDTNGKILLDDVTHTVTLSLSAATTSGYSWKTGVYDLELVSPTGVVTTLLSGTVAITAEVTT